MLNKFKFFFCIVLVSFMWAACSEEGDPGPQGDPGEQGPAGENAIHKVGYFEGTVSGTRQDGTAFTESFKYEYGNDSLLAFYEEGGAKSIDLIRFGTSTSKSRITMYLKSEEGGVLVPQSNTYSLYFNFYKELDNDNLFAIAAQASFEETQAFVREISSKENKTYNFSANSNRKPYYYETTYYGNGVPESAYMFNVYLNNKYHEIYYSEGSGSLLGLRESDQYIKDGDFFDLYHKLKFLDHPELGMPVFYGAQSGEWLYEEIPDVPADALTITNYTHDETSGVMTFDFELKISGHITNNRTNSTEHDLTITGSFNSGAKVYKNTVSRIGG